MKTRLLIIPAILIFSFAMMPTIFAQCDPDPNDTRAPCDDTYEILVLESSQIQKINEIEYHVSEIVDPYSTSDEILFHGVLFSLPYTNNPPRHIYSDVTFPDGTKETIDILHHLPGFSNMFHPKLDLLENQTDMHFL